MRDRTLGLLLAGIWGVGIGLGELGLLGEAPSLYVMPVVAMLAGWHARSLRSAAVLPVVSMLPLIALFGLVRAAADGLTAALVDQLVVMTVIHAVPVLLVGGLVWWGLHRFGLGPVQDEERTMG